MKAPELQERKTNVHVVSRRRRGQGEFWGRAELFEEEEDGKRVKFKVEQEDSSKP